jgi:L-rhamnose-H+ transport protein
MMQGTFVVPLKATTKWEYENTWLLFCFIGFVGLPLLLVCYTIPDFSHVLLTSPLKNVVLTAVFGVAWGCGAVLFGLGAEKLGVGLGLSIITGLSSTLGSLIPWVIAGPQPLSYSVLLWLGVVVMLAGVAVCARAGMLREQKQKLKTQEQTRGRQFAKGLLICIASGVLVSCLNLGFISGIQVAVRAETLGATHANAPNMVWAIIMGAGFAPNALYCGWLLVGKHSWQKFLARESVSYLGWTLVMAILWVGSLIIYGSGANKIGALGPSLGWPILSSANIVTSNLWGVITGEWRGAGKEAGRIMAIGIVILLFAIVIFGWASSKT